MELIKTQNFYNLMNSYKNKSYDSGVPSEFSNAPNVDNGRNLLTMKTGTLANGIYTPNGEQKIIQCGRYGFINPVSASNKIHVYDDTLTAPIAKSCRNSTRFGTPALFFNPYVGNPAFESAESYTTYEGLSFLLCDDDDPITLQTSYVEGNCATLSSPTSGNANLTNNGFAKDYVVTCNNTFTAKKLLVCMGSQWYAPTTPPVLLAGAVFDTPVNVSNGGSFQVFIGNEFVYE